MGIGSSKVKLHCAVVGVPESIFTVNVDANKSVEDLKKQIVEQSDGFITVPPATIQLFLAKKGNAWLSDESKAARYIMMGEIHEDIRVVLDGEEMLDKVALKDLLKSKNMKEASSNKIHILLVLPDTTTAIVESRGFYHG